MRILSVKINRFLVVIMNLSEIHGVQLRYIYVYIDIHIFFAEERKNNGKTGKEKLELRMVMKW